MRGAAIEVRINAEDPDKNFHAVARPRRRADACPPVPGVRIDTMLYPGYVVPPFYDSLLGKLIVHAEDRPSGARAAAAARSTSSRSRASSTTAALHLRLARLTGRRRRRGSIPDFLERLLAAA